MLKYDVTNQRGLHLPLILYGVFFFNDTATTEIYTLSLHDALPICRRRSETAPPSSPAASCTSSSAPAGWAARRAGRPWRARDRKSTRLNSSHSQISYAVFCLKKKNSASGILDIGTIH